MLGGYSLVDVAHKVVGVGSVGLRAYVALLEGSSADDVLFLQIKQARRSVIARFVHGDSAWHAHQGQRVVEYQQALQTVSDPLLGWTTLDGMQYYVRQFRDMKGSITLDAIDAAALTDYAGIVGHLLAKGHARTSGASMIDGYAGGSDRLDQALCRFARAYADQTEADHAALVRGGGARRAAGRGAGAGEAAPAGRGGARRRGAGGGLKPPARGAARAARRGDRRPEPARQAGRAAGPSAPARRTGSARRPGCCCRLAPDPSAVRRARRRGGAGSRALPRQPTTARPARGRPAAPRPPPPLRGWTRRTHRAARGRGSYPARPAAASRQPRRGVRMPAGAARPQSGGRGGGRAPLG